MSISFEPIGFVRTNAIQVPRHWSVSDLEGELDIQPHYLTGIKDIRAGQRIAVIFHFHRSPPFVSENLLQTPPNRREASGIFSICSPLRPNPIGLSILEVIDVDDNVIRVKGIDMFDGTPILDIKPHIRETLDCPSVVVE